MPEKLLSVQKGPVEGRSLTPEQIAFYEKEGYLVLPAFLGPDDMAPVRAAMEQKVDEIAWELFETGKITHCFEAEPFSTRLARLFESLCDEDPTAEETQKVNEYSAGFFRLRHWRERRAGYFHLLTLPKIIDAVESLIGPEIFASPVYNVRPKVPKVAAGAVPWHQDKSYWPDANANPVITVWVALVDVTPENGCLYVWPRTHRKRLLSFHDTENSAGTRHTEIDTLHLDEAEREAVALPLVTGGAILFNDRCVHMSPPNRSHVVRWSVDLRYQPTDQDPMLQYGAGCLVRSRKHPERVATHEDWVTGRLEHTSSR